ncbi:MAG: nitrate/nitrite transporter NrtS [Leptospiraceae bacterium]|nr:nitrate/nitrite transporter NrtS [Leptospiraceae bacterium]
MNRIKKTNIILALKISCIVGTILALINHYDMFLSGNFELSRIAKILVTYIIPFSVSIYSSTFAKRE